MKSRCCFDRTCLGTVSVSLSDGNSWLRFFFGFAFKYPFPRFHTVSYFLPFFPAGWTCFIAHVSPSWNKRKGHPATFFLSKTTNWSTNGNISLNICVLPNLKCNLSSSRAKAILGEQVSVSSKGDHEERIVYLKSFAGESAAALDVPGSVSQFV